MNRKKIILLLLIVALTVFFTWRVQRPMQIFVVADSFALPVPVTSVPDALGDLSARQCGSCHADFYNEWQTSIHSQAWTDPYFQVDWEYDGKQQVCKNCHIPLSRQQEHRVLGFNDRDRLQPVLVDNPDFNPDLQKEGVTCAACHLREGRIRGTYGVENDAHPVTKIDNANEICVQCHVVDGDRWDTFFRYPPCGTVAEAQVGMGKYSRGRSGETVVDDVASLQCVECHMPLVERSIVEGGVVRKARRHLWRGGHDPEMVKQALDINFIMVKGNDTGEPVFDLTMTNIQGGHFVPTGTPDRHLTVHLRILSEDNTVLHEESHELIRSFMWRPFIVELSDTRLVAGEPRIYSLKVADRYLQTAAKVEAVVRYHLLKEERRQLIGYENKTPIAYDVFRKQIPVN